MVTKTHLTCPECDHKDCYTLFDDGGGFCHSCGYKHKAQKEAAPLTEELELAFEAMPYRGLTQSTVDELNILTGVLPDGTEYSRVYPYPHRPKTRVLPKDFSKNKGFTNDYLLGMDKWNAGSSKAITIVEGEDDWAACYQLLGGKWPVVALPGASTVTRALLRNCYDYLNAFSTVIIATDSDDAGERAANTLATTFPNKCYRVNMTKWKDPMDYLENGDGSEFTYAWVNRQKYVPPFDTNTPEQFLKLFHEEQALAYIPTGIEAYDQLGLGLFQGILTVFTAPEGIGKTELMRYLEYNMIKNHPDIPFAFCHLEETPQRSLLGLVSYKLEKNLVRKELIEDHEEVETAITEMMAGENVHQFRIGADEDPDVLVERIKYYANVCGCKYIFFEPLQDIAHQRTEGNLVEFLDQLSVKLSRTAAELGVGIITIAHMNDQGSVRDSRSIQKQAGVRVDLERNAESPHIDERNKTRLIIRKNRPVGPVGAAGELVFDPNTFTLREEDYAFEGEN
jgi:twinkle protein